MTSLIRQASAHNAIRSLQNQSDPVVAASPSDPFTDSEQARLQDEVARLTAALDEQIRLTDAIRSAANDEILEARDKGYAEGLAAAVSREEDRITALQIAVDEAVATFDEQLAGSERLAALLARECLDRMFGQDDDQTALLHRLITHQLRQIEAGSHIALSVSPQDFPDLATLSSIVPIGGPCFTVEHRADLNPGQLVMTLQLGALEVGLDRQWGRLRATLGELAEA